MSYESECEEIRVIIAKARRKGHVRVWPVDLKRRILSLCEIQGAAPVAAAISVSASAISLWKSELPVEKVIAADAASLAVTRVSVNAPSRTAGATLEFANGRMVFHSDELALKVARELLGRPA